MENILNEITEEMSQKAIDTAFDIKADQIKSCKNEERNAYNEGISLNMFTVKQ